MLRNTTQWLDKHKYEDITEDDVRRARTEGQAELLNELLTKNVKDSKFQLKNNNVFVADTKKKYDQYVMEKMALRGEVFKLYSDTMNLTKLENELAEKCHQAKLPTHKIHRDVGQYEERRMRDYDKE